MINSVKEYCTLRFGKRSSRADIWVTKRERGLSVTEKQELETWLSSDPRNEEAFFESEIAWQQLGLIDDNYQQRKKPKDPVVSAVRFRHAKVLMAGAVAACLLLSVLWFENSPVEEEAAALKLIASKYEKHVLEDGSQLEIKKDTELWVQFTEHERRIRLIRGEAFFRVQGQPSWPFIVASDLGNVIATGTEFSVKRSTELFEVWVREGTVNVTEPERENGTEEIEEVTTLSVGQMVIRDNTSESIKTKVVDVSNEEMEIQLAWIDQIINFDSTPLYEIVAEFNRHNETKMVIVDDELKTVKLTIAIERENYLDFIDMLELSLDVEAEFVGSIILISKTNAYTTPDDEQF